MRILIIEDDKALCRGITYYLANEGYIVDQCTDGLDGLHFAMQSAYDLILLDRMLPSLDGLTLLQRLRKNNISTPVILVTAMTELTDKINGFNSGADDYISKPFDIEELVVRVHAILRRSNQLVKTDLLSYHDITFTPSTCLLVGPTSSYELSKREGTLIELFLRSPNITLSRNILFCKVWGPDATVEDGNLDNYIHLIRRRLQTVGSTLQIKTLRNIGYRLENIHAE